MLLKTQRNDLFNILTDKNLSAADFAENNSSKVYQLAVISSPLWLQIIEEGASHRINTFPSMRFDPSHELLGMPWNRVLTYFRKWASIVRDENDAPDLWAEAQANAKLFALNSSVPNEVFNDAELRQLQGQVRQLVQGLMTLGLPANAQKLLTETVNEIPEKATRFTKKELAGWFMGAFAAQVTNLALSQEHVSAIATLIKTTFMGILQLH